MKSFILSASILAVFVGLSSCEKHEWDKTKQLYESHDAHGHDDHAGHGHDEHAEEGHADKERSDKEEGHSGHDAAH
ncbi:MAG: hypothetical protein ABGY95_11540 [Rubritalea sp.]|uniref:hypothetical protein n=1 Tax=Rubritalea sp. TaxID=2109375 RepID=UPI003242A40E